MSKFDNYFKTMNLYILVGLGVFAIPFMLTTSTLDPALTIRFLTLAIILLVVLISLSIIIIKNRSTSDFTILSRPLFISLLGYLFFSLISLAAAINVTNGIYELIKTISFVALFYVVTTIIKGEKKAIIIFVKTITISAFIHSFIGICQYYFIGFNFIPGKYIIYSTMVNKNLFSSFLFLTLPFVLYGFFRFFGYWLIINSCTFVLLLFALFLARTRSVWLAIIVSTLITISICKFIFKKVQITKGKKYFFRNRLIVGLAIIIVVVFSSILSYQFYTTKKQSIQQIFMSKKVPITASLNERIALWKKSVQIFTDNPILGVGIGNWKIVLPNYGTTGMRSESGLTHFQRPHNDFLWVLTEIGMTGFICYSLIFIISIGYILKIVFHTLIIEHKIFSLCMLFGILGYTIIGFFSFPKERIAQSIYLVIIIGSVVKIYDSQFPSKKYPKWSIVFLFNNLMIFSLLFSVFWGLQSYKNEIHIKKALIAWNQGLPNSVISEVDKIDFRFTGMDPMSTPLSWYRGVAYFGLNKTKKSFENFKAAHNIHPYHIHVLNNLATCYELEGDHENAILYYQQALKISPTFEDALINLSIVYYNIGMYKEGYKILTQGAPKSKNIKYIRALAAIKEKLLEGIN